MTMHGVTSPVVFDVTAQFSADRVSADASTVITFDQFGMTKPRLFFIVSVADEISLELEVEGIVTAAN